jgi:hypothetical protein
VNYRRKQASKNLERLLFHEPVLPDSWSVINPILQPPALPHDLRVLWNPLAACLHTEVYNSNPMLNFAFAQPGACSKAVGDWIKDPPYWDPKLSTKIVDYDDDSLRSLIMGWSMRRIIDGFVHRWAGVVDRNGKYDSDAIHAASEAIVYKMLHIFKLLDDIERHLKAWDEPHKMPHDDRRGSQRYLLTVEMRYWCYEELCLLRAELWHRYHLKDDTLVKSYLAGKLHWQFCWFLDLSINPDFKSLLLGAVGIGACEIDVWLGLRLWQWQHW